MKRRKTAGELSLKASSDTTKYNALEVGHALSDDILEQIRICINNHKNIINEDEFCVVLVIAKDPLIQNVMRKKFYAWPYLPKPRPSQVCFLYNRITNKIIRLWSLPDAITMATASNMTVVSKQWARTKRWCDVFYEGWHYDSATDSMVNKNPNRFFEYIRNEHKINMLSESEYLNAHREELIKAGCKEIESFTSETFDFSKIAVNQIVSADTTRVE